MSLDAAGHLEFVPFQTADLARIAPGLTVETASRTLHLVLANGQRYVGARAVFEILRRLPGGWSIVGIIGALPPLSLLAEPFYRLFARYRGTISRRLGLERCDLPSTETR